MIISQYPDSVAIRKPAIPYLHPVGVGDPDDIAPDGLERTFPDGRTAQFAGIEPDQEIIRILRLLPGIVLKGESGNVHPAEITGGKIENGRGYGLIRLPYPYKTEAWKLFPIRKISIDIVAQARPVQVIHREIQITALDLRNGPGKESIPRCDLDI